MLETLEKYGFFKYKDGLYYDGGWEYMFNPFKNTLYLHCEVAGDLTFLVKVKNKKELEEAFESLNILKVEEDDKWCYYSGMPSPMAYMVCDECKEGSDKCLCKQN